MWDYNRQYSELYHGVSFNEQYTDQNDELAHYGKLGMKWKLHRAKKHGETEQYSKAYSKAMNKTKKYERKAFLYDNAYKQELYNAEHPGFLTRMFGSSTDIENEKNKHLVRAAKNAEKARQAKEKAKRWMNDVSNSFSDVDAKYLNQSDIDYAKKWWSNNGN